jgi:hypothetical protein
MVRRSSGGWLSDAVCPRNARLFTGLRHGVGVAVVAVAVERLGGVPSLSGSKKYWMIFTPRSEQILRNGREVVCIGVDGGHDAAAGKRVGLQAAGP